MSVDFEHELRAEMERAPIRPRPGMVREAYRRSRRHAHAVRAATAACVATVTAMAAAIVVTALGPSRPARPATQVLAGYISRALTASPDIIVIRNVYAPPSINYGTYLKWNYRDSWRDLQLDQSGKPVSGQTATFTQLPDGRIKDVRTQVDYHARTVTKITQVLPVYQPAGLAPTTCGDVIGLSGLVVGQADSDTMASAIRTLLTCDKSVIIGHQRISGIEAITITYHYPHNQGTQVLYVNESTYLPFHLTSTISGPSFGGTDTYFSWLPPTRANLAQLTTPIPPGFKVIVTRPWILPPLPK
jgi:hypothetical protein